MIKVFFILPCYNEEAVLPETAIRLLKKVTELVSTGKIDPLSRIVFIDDGSKDQTWEIITKLTEQNSYYAGLKLSKNKGHQSCLFSGYIFAQKYCDCCISMDADLQDDISVIDKFIDNFKLGYDIVYGVRSSRAKDTFFKKISAQMFYKFMKVLGCDIVYNHADYRLLSKRVLEQLSRFKEVNLFIRGIIPTIGFKSTVVEYERHERFAGETKYPLKKMLAFAFEGITSFSIKPIRIITISGMLIFLVSIILTLYFSISKLFNLPAVQGWTSLISILLILGGLQLFAIGSIGEYIGKIYLETKQRPLYFIEEERINFET